MDQVICWKCGSFCKLEDNWRWICQTCGEETDPGYYKLEKFDTIDKDELSIEDLYWLEILDNL